MSKLYFILLLLNIHLELNTFLKSKRIYLDPPKEQITWYKGYC